jgi:arsenical-resistance protein 2
MSVPEQKPWHAAYPKPVSTAVFLPQETVLEWMESGEKVPGRDFVLVDLRRMDHEVSCLLYNLAM